MPKRSYSAGDQYRYGFNGKENDNEVKGEGNQQDYGMRIYDTRLGRFLSVDPLAKSFPWNSPYSYAEGDLIRSIDLDGLEKYIIHQRSFAPWEFFGEFWHYKVNADNRGFTVSTSNGVDSKVSTSLTVDIGTAKASVSEARQIGNTRRYDTRTGKVIEEARPVHPEVSLWQPQKDGNKLTIKSRLEGKAPIAPIPQLNFIKDLMNQPIVWTGTTAIENHISEGFINIKYTYIGKGFPALEAFIEDMKGAKIFIGYHVSPPKSKLVATLSGSEFATSQSFTLRINVDEEGTFLGVPSKDNKGNDIILSPSGYNKRIETKQAAKDLPEKDP